MQKFCLEFCNPKTCHQPLDHHDVVNISLMSRKMTDACRNREIQQRLCGSD